MVEKVETSAVVETKNKAPMVVGNKAPMMIGANKPRDAKKVSMKERMEKNYSFTNDLVEDLFENLLEQNLIFLLEVKRPYEVGKIDNPKYCPYHCLFSYPLKECFVLKDKIQDLLDSKVITLLPPEKETVNLVTTDDGDEGDWVVY